MDAKEECGVKYYFFACLAMALIIIPVLISPEFNADFSGKEKDTLSHVHHASIALLAIVVGVYFYRRK